MRQMIEKGVVYVTYLHFFLFAFIFPPSSTTLIEISLSAKKNTTSHTIQTKAVVGNCS